MDSEERNSFNGLLGPTNSFPARYGQSMKWLLYATNLSNTLLGLRSQRLYFIQQQKLCELPFLYGESKTSAREKERRTT